MEVLQLPSRSNKSLAAFCLRHGDFLLPVQADVGIESSVVSMFERIDQEPGQTAACGDAPSGVT